MLKLWTIVCLLISIPAFSESSKKVVVLSPLLAETLEGTKRAFLEANRDWRGTNLKVDPISGNLVEGKDAGAASAAPSDSARAGLLAVRAFLHSNAPLFGLPQNESARLKIEVRQRFDGGAWKPIPGAFEIIPPVLMRYPGLPSVDAQFEFGGYFTVRANRVVAFEFYHYNRYPASVAQLDLNTPLKVVDGQIAQLSSQLLGRELFSEQVQGSLGKIEAKDISVPVLSLQEGLTPDPNGLDSFPFKPDNDPLARHMRSFDEKKSKPVCVSPAWRVQVKKCSNENPLDCRNFLFWFDAYTGEYLEGSERRF